jgi:small subunit ribosomal protein S5
MTPETNRRSNKEPEVPVLTPLEEAKIEKPSPESSVMSVWKPKTSLGRQVKEGVITNIDEILDKGQVILESEISDVLLPGLGSDLLMVGQSKGKFGGGSRRVFRQTQKKTQEGNKPSFATMAVVGNKDGYVGLGLGKARETVPAREKAVRKAKLRIFKVPRGCGSWRCNCHTPHSIPFTVSGKCGSVIVTLMPAPKGKGLICEKEVQKILALAGVKDVWSKIKGQARNKINLVHATEAALKKISSTKVSTKTMEELAFHSGKIQNQSSLISASQEEKSDK